MYEYDDNYVISAELSGVSINITVSRSDILFLLSAYTVYGIARLACQPAGGGGTTVWQSCVEYRRVQAYDVGGDREGSWHDYLVRWQKASTRSKAKPTTRAKV